MIASLIASLLSLGSSLLPFTASAQQAPFSSSSSTENDERHAVKEDLERLMRTLERIKATLYDAEEREIRDRSVKLWLKELKRVAYDTEDLLGEYRYEATRVEVEARMTSEASGPHKRKKMEFIIPIPDRMVERLKIIRNRFDEIAKDRDALQLREIDGERRLDHRILRPPTGHMVDERSIFGREAEIMEVIDLLVSEKERHFSVISIIGKGGLGKTTIAQLAYKDSRIHQCFDLLGWVCVSEEFGVSRLTKATVESVSKMNCSFSELSPLQEELAKTVKGKRMLLVLDDVWNKEQSLWELFRIPLNETKLVRILVTTRDKKVAEVMQTTACSKPLGLSEDSCWQLFQHYAFGSASHTMPTHIVEMGREVMRKCCGLPLAVKSIACLLSHETNEESWREILESDLWQSDPSNDIFPALQISYAHLPTHLRPCFLLCSMYPKNYELKKLNLIELWISHGYIEPQGKKSITEVGIEYYEELKERSFLDELSNQFSEHCKLHDIIHDLARLNSGNEYYSVDINQSPNIQDGYIWQEIYHLYAKGFKGYINQILQHNLKGLRTLSTDLRGCREHSEHQYCINNTEVTNHIYCTRNTTIFDLTRFEALRVLELKGDNLREIHDSIVQLKHLSYLRIISDSLQILPLSIGRLYNLQTFILDCYKSPLKFLPESIGYLANLRYLCIECAKIEKLPNKLIFLRNLLRLDIKSNFLKELPSDLRRLCYLQQVTIYSDQMKELPGSIGCLKNLMELELSLGDSFQELPTDIGNLQKLKTLKIHNCVCCPLNYNPHGYKKFVAMRTMQACLSVVTIAWLKDMKDLEGELIIKGLENITNLADARLANLAGKCKIETLDLCWHNRRETKHYHVNILRISIEKTNEATVVRADMDFRLLECLQPHSHLKNFVLQGYLSDTLPNWMGDPFSLKAIQKISLESCQTIQCLPFCNLHTLKHLSLFYCDSILFLQLEQLPSKIEKLKIMRCDGLELITGLHNLGMIAVLEIASCHVLKSIAMDGLQLVESTEPLDDSSRRARDNWQGISSLKKLDISSCPLLHGLTYELIPSGRCAVRFYGCGCPDISFG